MIEHQYKMYKQQEIPMSKIIKNTKGEPACNPIDCFVKTVGCSKNLESKLIETEFDATDKMIWILRMRRDVFDGYEMKVCIRCENTLEKIVYDNLVIRQIASQNSLNFPLEGFIKSITALGEVTVEFSRVMRVEYNSSLVLNHTIIDMWVIPHDDWHLETNDINPSFNMSTLNFTWNCTSFVKRNAKF